jgi:hypothetical protein
MPWLRDRAVRDGPQMLWEHECFALADGFDEPSAKYRALVLPTDGVTAVTDATASIARTPGAFRKPPSFAGLDPSFGYRVWVWRKQTRSSPGSLSLIASAEARRQRTRRRDKAVVGGHVTKRPDLSLYGDNIRLPTHDDMLGLSPYDDR